MAETTNIAKIAEQVSRDLFEVFDWNRNKITNCNWDCVHPEKHQTKSGTHPTDVVWYYDEPYENKRTYVQADLKSYAKGSISSSTIKSSLHSLIMAVECAADSPGWRNRYLIESEDSGPIQVVGLLFIYNHDGGFDSTFHSLLLESLNGFDFMTNPSIRVMVMGPQQIWELYSIASHIKQLYYGEEGRLERIPFYPEGRISRFRRLPKDGSVAMTIDSLFSNVISYKVNLCTSNNHFQHLHVYYRGLGKTKEEFLHLIDSFFRYQMVETMNKILVHHVSVQTPNDEAAVNFERARNEIAMQYNVGTKKLNSLEFETLPFTKPGFSATEIGMRS